MAHRDALDPSTWTLVTPTFRGDREQFELLTRSFLQFAPDGLTHRVIVDQRDRQLFEPLRHDRMELVTTEELLPGMVRRVSRPRPMFVGTRIPPVRGWIAQQLVKIQAAITSPTPYVLFADSDVVFLRRFGMDRFTDGEKLALSRVRAQYDSLVDWRRTSAALLGLSDPEGFAVVNYVSALIPWRRDTAIRLVEALESESRLPWTASIGRRLRFSEYTLYGVFCEEVLGLDEAGHYGWDDPIMNLCWDEPMGSLDDFRALLARTEPVHIGAMFHSKHGFDRSQLRQAVEERWSAEAAA